MPEVPVILLVDTDANTNQNVEALFNACHYDWMTVGSALEAFAYIRANPVNLMLLELSLPDVDGMCLLSMIRRSKPALPVVIVTHDHSVESMLKAMRLGARGYLIKPLLPEQVLECVQALLLEAHIYPRHRIVHRYPRERVH